MNYKIKKAKLNGRALIIDMEELVTSDDVTVTNYVTKKCAHLAHEDLLNAFQNLIPHVIAICDFRGSDLVNAESIENAEELISKLKEFKLGDYQITGISEGGNDDSPGVTIVAQRTFESGKVLNIVTPFTQYFSDDYKYGNELCASIERCMYEVEQYLFEHKFAEKQLEMDFCGMDEIDMKVTVSDNNGNSAEFDTNKLTEKLNKKISKKQKQLAEEAA